MREKKSTITPSIIVCFIFMNEQQTHPTHTYHSPYRLLGVTFVLYIPFMDMGSIFRSTRNRPQFMRKKLRNFPELLVHTLDSYHVQHHPATISLESHCLRDTNDKYLPFCFFIFCTPSVVSYCMRNYYSFQLNFHVFLIGFDLSQWHTLDRLILLVTVFIAKTKALHKIQNGTKNK